MNRRVEYRRRYNSKKVKRARMKSNIEWAIGGLILLLFVYFVLDNHAKDMYEPAKKFEIIIDK